MDRTAHVIRTPKGQNHLNRLRVPEWGVASLLLSVGGKTSRSHRPKGAPAVEGADAGTDDFHFLPQKETLEVVYEVSDPFGAVDGGMLELFCRFDSAPLWSLDLKQLGPDWWAHGLHAVKWDGRVVRPEGEAKGTVSGDRMEHDLTALKPAKDLKAFPDGFVTLEHTPYKLKLTLTSSATRIAGHPAIAWTYFHLLIKGIELELGPEEALPATKVDDAVHKRDKALLNKLRADGGLPAAGATRKCFLISNLFKISSAEMNDNTAYDEYLKLWRGGPKIPIFAKIRMADSSDAEVKLEEADLGAVALGNVNFLWEWEDPDEDIDGTQSGKPKDFLKAAVDYFKNGTDPARAAKDHTYPKGDNCHVDRGGKRGPDAGAVFTHQAGYDPKDTLDVGKFPFQVLQGGAGTGPKFRRWAAYSRAWTRGKLKGKTGVLFRPSRMGGDDYKINVYLAYDKSKPDRWVLDAQTEPLACPPAIKQSTGSFQIWRQLHLARYIRKNATIPDFLAAHMGGIQAAYRKAFVEIRDARTADDSYLMAEHKKADSSTPDYNDIAENALLGTGAGVFTDHLASDAAANHAADAAAFRLRTYEDYVIRVHVFLHGGHAADLTADQARNLGAAALAGLPASNRKNRLIATQNALKGNGTETLRKYSNTMTDVMPFRRLLDDLQTLSGGRKKAAANGISIVHFDYVHSVVSAALAAGGASILLGVAPSVADGNRNRCVFVFFKSELDTFLHEVGHHVFLPHSRHHTGNASVPAGSQDNRHDDDDTKCTMSYSNDAADFCGLCQLRLRGWDANKLDKDDAKNKKP